MKISNDGLELIKKHEGLRLETYDDGVGVPTIGYGSTGSHVYWGKTITKSEANDLLKKDVNWAEDVINKTVLVNLNQNEFDALVSFVFNIGSEAFANSTLLEYLNKNKRKLASKEFERWIYAGGQQLEGLIKRRESEKQLFNQQTKQFSFKIQAKTNTVLKIGSTKQSSELSENEFQKIQQYEYIFVDTYEEAENGHYKLELSFDAGTRYIFSDHWNLSWEESNEKEYVKKEIKPQNNIIPFSIDNIDWNNFDEPVSKYFTVGEVVQWEKRRIPKTNLVKQNIVNFAKKLDVIREKWGSAIGVTSWYRPYNVNAEVGGVPNSQHLTGGAVDIYPYIGNIEEFQKWLNYEIWTNNALGLGSNRGFVHLDNREKKLRWTY